MVDSARNQSVPGIFIPTSAGTDIRHTRNGVHEIPDKTLKNKEIIFKKGQKQGSREREKAENRKNGDTPGNVYINMGRKARKMDIQRKRKNLKMMKKM